MNIQFKENILQDNFFRKFQQLSLIAHSLHLFDELNLIWDKDVDTLLVEYDETVQVHILLHTHNNETRAICYIDQDNFNMKAYHSFIIEALREAWVEELL